MESLLEVHWMHIVLVDTKCMRNISSAKNIKKVGKEIDIHICSVYECNDGAQGWK